MTETGSVQIETEKRRRGIVLLLVLAPILLFLGSIIAGLVELATGFYSPPPKLWLIVFAVIATVISLLSPAQLLTAGIIQLRRGIRNGLSLAAIWVGAALILLALISVVILMRALLS